MKKKTDLKAQPTIFISIASYRDPELLPTLLDMIKEAKHPERLRIGVCWQDDQNTQPFIDAGMKLVKSLEHDGVPVYHFQYKKAVIELLSFHYFASQGACWARHSVELHYKQEDYFLQIDSHCRFITHWDNEMITMLEGLREQSKHPVLSSYPPGYTPGNDESRTKYVSRLVFRAFNNEKILGLSSTPFESATPLRCGYLAAGFLFADGHFVTKVPNDPQIFFLGEEIAMAARAFTHGYDIWSPSKILLWHFYSRKDHPKVWGDHNTQAKNEGSVEKVWWERDKISKMRVLNVLNASDDECDLGPYCLGNVRSLQEFQYRIGVDFREQKVHPDVIGKEKINWFDELPTDHNQWLLQLRCLNEKLLQIPKEELDLTRTDIAWWHVGVYSTQNTPLMVKQYTPEEMRKHLRDIDEKMVELTVRFTTINHSPANNIRICPYYTQEGWGQVVEKPW